MTCVFNTSTYQLGEEMPIALDGLRRAVSIQIPQRACSSHNTKRGHNSYPDIEETRGKVITYGAHRAPALVITA